MENYQKKHYDRAQICHVSLFKIEYFCFPFEIIVGGRFDWIRLGNLNVKRKKAKAQLNILILSNLSI